MIDQTYLSFVLKGLKCKCIESSEHRALKNMNISKTNWEDVEKIKSQVRNKLFCMMKCVENNYCGAALYHEDSGICEMAEVCILSSCFMVKLY